jgi:predicted ester cyclase
MTSAAGIIRSAAASFNAGDGQGYVAHFAPSGLRWVAGFDQPLGVSEVEENLGQLAAAFVPLRLEEELIISEGAFVSARWRLRGTQTGAFMGLASHGADIDVPTCEVYEVAGNRVVATWTYQDPGQMFRQMALGSPGGEG